MTFEYLIFAFVVLVTIISVFAGSFLTKKAILIVFLIMIYPLRYFVLGYHEVIPINIFAFNFLYFFLLILFWVIVLVFYNKFRGINHTKLKKKLGNLFIR